MIFYNIFKYSDIQIGNNVILILSITQLNKLINNIDIYITDIEHYTFDNNLMFETAYYILEDSIF